MRIATPARFAMLFVLGLLLTPAAPQNALAASPAEIDAEVDAALVRFYEEVPAAKDLTKKAKGMLIFPQRVQGSSPCAPTNLFKELLRCPNRLLHLLCTGAVSA